MLPRAEMYKEVIFIPRIICFNESFVPVGKYQKHLEKPLAVIWHEGVAGRKKEDIISAFNAFFIRNKDKQSITIWLDNCSAQNKNWAILCFFIYIVNSSDVSLFDLEIKYFEPGHTFMSADSFHHQVEKSLVKLGKVFDFDHYKDAVGNANLSKVHVDELKINNFFKWKDFTSKYKLKKLQPRVYLQNMVHLQFKRGQRVLFYKTKFCDEEFQELNFLAAKYVKESLPKPQTCTLPRGIDSVRKNNLIEKLRAIIPPHRINFWENLPVSQENTAIDSESDNEL